MKKRSRDDVVSLESLEFSSSYDFEVGGIRDILSLVLELYTKLPGYILNRLSSPLVNRIILYKKVGRKRWKIYFLIARGRNITYDTLMNRLQSSEESLIRALRTLLDEGLISKDQETLFQKQGRETQFWATQEA